MARIIVGPANSSSLDRLQPAAQVVYVENPVEVIKEILVSAEPQIVYVDKPVEKIVEVIKEVKVPEYITQEVEKIVYVDKPVEVEKLIIQEKEVIKEVPIEVVKEVKVPFHVTTVKTIEKCPRWAMYVMACEAAIIGILTLI